MIFTECVNEKCNEPFVYHYEAGEEPFGRGVFGRHICEKCGTENFVMRISFDGETIDREEFEKRAGKKVEDSKVGVAPDTETKK